MRKSTIVILTGLALVVMVVIVAIVTREKIPDPSNFLEGEVVWVGGNLTNLEANPEFSGLLSYSNETVRFGDPSLVFGVQTTDGVYTIQLDPTDRGGSSGPQTVHNLASVLRVGIKVRFPTELYGRESPNRAPMGFSKSKIGMLDPDDVELLIE